METWIKEDENTTIPNCLCPSGYNTISVPHINRTGGHCIGYRSNLDVRTNTSYTFESMECVDFNLNLDRHNILLAVIYRPPNTSVLPFANECWNHSIYQTVLISQPTNCKIHWTLSSTHKTQGVSETYVKDTFFRHHLVLFDITSESKVSLSRKQAFRKYKSISQEDFSDDVIKELKSVNITDTTTDDLVSAYDRSLKSVLDTHTPLKVKSISCSRKGAMVQCRPSWSSP